MCMCSCVCMCICNLNKSFVILSSHFTSLPHTHTHVYLKHGIYFSCWFYFITLFASFVSPRLASPAIMLFFHCFFTSFCVLFGHSFGSIICLVGLFVCLWYDLYIIYIVNDRLSAYILCNRPKCVWVWKVYMCFATTAHLYLTRFPWWHFSLMFLFIYCYFLFGGNFHSVSLFVCFFCSFKSKIHTNFSLTNK